MFNPACIWCGARVIQQLGSLPIAQSECSHRRRAMLAVWTQWGHDEMEIRKLAKGSMALGPEPSTASERQTPPRRR